MLRPGDKATLYLNHHPVGAVTVRGSNTSWHFGTFAPNDAFSPYALPFGRWSLLMHAQDTDPAAPMDPYALEELRHIEFVIDHLHAQLHLPEKNEWHPIAQLNIDGPLIEWKRF